MQDAHVGIFGCSLSRTGRDIVWAYLKNNWSKLVERYGEKSSFLVSFVDVRFYFLFE